MQKICQKVCDTQKSSIFAPLLSKILGYGVMVTLQILVLPFLVRVRVAQQNKRETLMRLSFILPGYSRPFFNLLCKWGALRALSLAYSLRPNTFVPAYYFSNSW